MATSKRVVSVSVKRPKRDRAQKIRTVASVASGDDEARAAAEVPLAAIVNSGYAKQMRAARNMLVEQRDHWKERAERAETEPLRGLLVARVNGELHEALKSRVDFVRKVCPDVWDSPWGDVTPDVDDIASVVDLQEFWEAIEYMRGAAAMADLTVLELIDTLDL